MGMSIIKVEVLQRQLLLIMCQGKTFPTLVQKYH